MQGVSGRSRREEWSPRNGRGDGMPALLSVICRVPPLQAMVLQANVIGVTEISKACLKAMSPSFLVEHQSI